VTNRRRIEPAARPLISAISGAIHPHAFHELINRQGLPREAHRRCRPNPSHGTCSPRDGADLRVGPQHAKPERCGAPNFFAKLMAQISSLRTSTGRPHWLLIDEAHHLVPASRNDVSRTLPEEIPAAIFITLHPEALSPGALKTAGVVIALGRGAPDVIAAFCKATGVTMPVVSGNFTPSRKTSWFGTVRSMLHDG
jgi:hypothetical protein